MAEPLGLTLTSARHRGGDCHAPPPDLDVFPRPTRKGPIALTLYPCPAPPPLHNFSKHQLIILTCANNFFNKSRKSYSLSPSALTLAPPLPMKKLCLDVCLATHENGRGILG